MNKIPEKETFDVRGERILAGDIIVYHSSVVGNIFGMVKYDSDKKTSIHIMKQGGGMQYIQKPWRTQTHNGIVNLSRLPADIDSLI